MPPRADGTVDSAGTEPKPVEDLWLADRLAAIATLAAGAAHQLNAPLSATTIHIEHTLRELRVVLSQGAAQAGTTEGFDRLAALLDSLVEALDGMARIREVVRNLLIFSRGTIEPRALVDVRSVLESSIQMSLHEIEPRARLVRELADVPPVEANQAELGQAFLNLMTNAAQAISEGDSRQHEVRVATHTDEAGNAIIEVSDTGVGIGPEALPRVFDPFFTSRSGEGAGLGLSITMGTIKSLGGTIQVSSERGQPTVFRVIMPPAKGWRSAAHEDESERKRMLVVDGHRGVGDALERALAGMAEVEATTDGRSVVDRLAGGERWDMILCDLSMPETSGMDLYREALRVAPDAAASVVFMTAGAFTPRARAFLDGVGNPCLEKPLDMGKLRSLIARVGSRRVVGAD
jgi:CheY-like chemotaxis protein/anti-sigma regulatory factor (Ser/Thr protein kinase)